MGEPQIITFTYKELTELMIKRQDIHEGMWSLTVQFAFNAALTKMGSTDEDTFIAANVGLVKFGLQRVDKPNPVSVDAAEVNPLSKP